MHLSSRLRFAAAVLLTPLLTAHAAPGTSTGDPVFRLQLRAPGQDGVFTCRIPALTTSPRGTLLAAFDLRHERTRDLPGNIDVGLMRSSDHGNSWSPVRRILDFDKDVPGTMGNGVGDPCILVDHRAGAIFVAAAWVRGQAFGKVAPIAPELAGQFMLTKSTDDGLTWSDPVNLTAQVKDPTWGNAVCVQGPGQGIQLHDGTLVLPAYYKTYPDGRSGNSYLLWSRDGGATWKRSAPALPGEFRSSEAQVAVLDDRTLLMSIRNHGPRKLRAWCTYAWSDDLATGRWSEPWFVLPDPICQASLIRHPSGVLLFSNPASKTQRLAMTVRASTDRGRTWNAGRVIDPGLSGYSCLTALPDGNVGILYEGGKERYNESLFFARFPLQWILDAPAEPIK